MLIEETILNDEVLSNFLTLQKLLWEYLIVENQLVICVIEVFPIIALLI
tara:strand:- start:887 stop:1033 length:147 start_codon:yes stop_codon:yes gene_type:complete